MINQLEGLKADLTSAWENDLQAGDVNRLMAKDSLVQQNISAREKLWDQAQSVLKRLTELRSDFLQDEQLQLTKQLADYFASEKTGLANEKQFFQKLVDDESTDQLILDAFNQVQDNRQTQTDELSSEPVKETSEPTETVTEAVLQYRLNEMSQLFEPLNGAPARAVLLTFDDVPITGDAKHSLSIAKKLKEQNVPAIFFVYGAYLNSEVGQTTVKELHDMGFALGNHSQNHPDLTKLSLEDARTELRILNDQLEAITGERPKFFRPPYGITNAEVSKLAREEGMIPMNWTYGYDWESDYQEASALAKIMVESPLLTPGANLLLHDRQNTAEAIEEIVKGLLS